jgi:hypothetical protein
MAKPGSPKVTLTDNNETDVELLSSQIAELQKELHQIEDSKKGGPKNFFRGLGIFTLVLVSAVALFLANHAYWAESVITNNKVFLATTAPIISSPEVQKYITNSLTTEIFKNVDVEARLHEYLPARIQFLAGPLSGQIKTQTTSQIAKFLATPKVAQVWTSILSNSQKSIVEYLSNDNNDGIITLNNVYKLAQNELAGTSAGFLLKKDLPPSMGQIEITKISWVPKVKGHLNLVKIAPEVLFGVLAVCSALALVLSKKKKQLLVVITGVYVATLALAYYSVAVGGLFAESQIASADKNLVDAVYAIVTAPLKSQTLAFLWIAVSAFVGALLAAPYKWVGCCVAFIRRGLESLANKALPRFRSPEWLELISKYSFALKCALTVLWYLVFAIKLPPSVGGVVVASVASAVSILVVEIARASAHQRPAKPSAIK